MLCCILQLFQEVARQQFEWEEEDPSAVLGSPDLVEAALQAAGYNNIRVGAQTGLRLVSMRAVRVSCTVRHTLQLYSVAPAACLHGMYC